MKKKRGTVIIGPKETIKQYYSEMLHIDLYVNVLPKRKILLVDPNYLKAHSKEVKQLAKKEKLKVITIDKSEVKMRPANFLTLPDGKILFNKAPKTIEKLKKAGVKEEDLIINKRKVEFNPEYGRGSIRFFTLTTK